MAVCLKKGQKISLTKEVEGLSKIMIGLGWDQVKKSGLRGLFGIDKADIDCDASVLLLRDGKLHSTDDIVYYGNLKHASGAVKHAGDNLTGEGDGDDEEIFIDLKKLPEDVNRIVISVTIYNAFDRGQHFGMIENAFCRVVDQNGNKELCMYKLDEKYDGMTAVVCGELVKDGSDWEFSADSKATRISSLGKLAETYR